MSFDENQQGRCSAHCKGGTKLPPKLGYQKNKSTANSWVKSKRITKEVQWNCGETTMIANTVKAMGPIERNTKFVGIGVGFNFKKYGRKK